MLVNRLASIFAILSTLFGAATAAQTASAPAAAAPEPSTVIANLSSRSTLNLNGAWHTIVDPYETGLGGRYFEDRKALGKNELIEYNFEAAPLLNVPGDWNSQRESLLFYEGPVWYQRVFSYTKRAGKRLFVYFGAINYKARVYLNGKRIGEHQGGFTPFNFEISADIIDGRNSLVVEADSTRSPDAIPAPNTDWWNYGGMTRDVALIEVPEVFIQDYFVQLAKGAPGQIAGWVQLNGAPAKRSVTLEIPEIGVRQAIQIEGTGRGEFRFSAKPQLWSPEHPKLYRTILSSAGDRVEDEIGFRTIETRGKQILLNGKPIFLRGISMHDEAAMRGGRAFSLEDDRALLGWAKELGCNFVRLAHYPHNENTIRLADRMGLLLWSEIPLYWGIQWDNSMTYENAQRQMRDMVARDHNRASVILWSLSNETTPSEARNTFLKNLAAFTRQLDDTRLLTSAMNKTDNAGPDTQSLSDPLGESLDVLGINEYAGWYWGKPEDADRLRWTSRYDKPMIISEFGGEAQAGLHGDSATRWTEEYQASLFQHQLSMIRNNPDFAGLSPWLLVDYRSPRRPLAGVQDYYNRKGLLSDRGERKLAFYVLQKFYNDAAASGK
jgi:beta-glucuronidase